MLNVSHCHGGTTYYCDNIYFKMNQTDRNLTVAELFQDESVNKTAEEEISDIMGEGAVGGHYDVNVEWVNHNVETSQLVDVEMKSMNEQVVVMYCNQIDMMSAQLQELREMLHKKEQEELDLKDKLNFECQNNAGLKKSLEEQVAHYEAQIKLRDENAKEIYEEQNAHNEQVVADLKRELSAAKANLEREKQKEVVEAIARFHDEQIKKLDEECKMRLELQNQLTTIESKLSAEARLVNDLQQECNKQKQLCRQEQEQKVEQEKLKLELEERLKLKEQQEFQDALLAWQLAEEEKQRVKMRVLEEEARCIEKERQKQQAQNPVTSLI